MRIFYKGELCVDIYVADLETTVDEDVRVQTETEVWAAGFAKLNSDTFYPQINNDFNRFFNRLRRDNLDKNKVVYFHNLAFDGSYVVDYLLRHGYRQAHDVFWDSDRDMDYKTFKCIIDGSGNWYSITVKTRDGLLIEFRDSYKLLRFSIDKLGEEIGLHKLDIDYIKNRKAGDNLTAVEQRYLRRDLEILWRVMREFVIEQGNYGITIGSCCMNQYNKLYSFEDRCYWFPNIAKMGLDSYFRNAYKGGLCYLDESKMNKTYKNGYTLDINSLYPYIADSELKFPIGKPHYFKGAPTAELQNHTNKVFFVRFRCRFSIKKDRIPFVQIRDNPWYKHSELLKTSDVYDPSIKDYVGYDEEGNSIRPELTMCDVDFRSFLYTYDVEEFEFIDGYWFYTTEGNVLFGKYMQKYKDMKESSNGIKRTISKMFLNYLIGKFGTNPVRSNLVPYLDNDGDVLFDSESYQDDRFNYIPLPCFVNAYGRSILLKAIYSNYKNFIYCDTDSLHLTGDIEELKGLKLDNSQFGCWKIERYWSKGRFFKRKCYIEYGIEKSGQKEQEYYIKASGMSIRAKNLLAANLAGKTISLKTDEEREFMSNSLSLETISKGLSVPGNLFPRRIKGGVLLVPDEYVF